MDIIKEGTIAIEADGRIVIRDFEIRGTVPDLRDLALSRLRLAAEQHLTGPIPVLVTDCDLHWNGISPARTPPMTTTPRVPLNPEQPKALRARYWAALVQIYDQLEVASGRVPSPSGRPEHVFDTMDGLRLIVSRERTPEGVVGLHLSVSFHNGEAVEQQYRGQVNQLTTWILDAWRNIADIRDPTVRPALVLVSEGGIPHFWTTRSIATTPPQ